MEHISPRRTVLRGLLALVLMLSLVALPSVGLLFDGRRSVAAPAAIISEGVEHVGADAWHEAGLLGQGVKLGILDAGFEDYDVRIEEGELPADAITQTFTMTGFGTGGGKNGTVMAEIAFDFAPEAQFFLVDTLPSEVGQFTDAVDWLIQQDVDVILYARNWLVGSSGDGRGPLTAKIEEAADNGILWVNSAGDSAQRHWEGDWIDLDGCPEALGGDQGGGCLDFAPGDNWNDIPNVSANQLVSVGLRWEDNWDMNTQFNYNLVLAFQQIPNWFSNTPNPNGYPVELLVETVDDDGTHNVAITRPPEVTGTTRLEMFLGWDPNFELEHNVVTGSIMTPADAQNAFVVGAADWRDDGLYDLSSRGPTNDGRIKPDLVAPHGVSTVTYWRPEEGARCPQPGSGACGTGTASAHVAGAAALVKSAFPVFSPAQIEEFLRTRALDLGSSGPDNDFGWGRLRLGSPPGQETPTATSTPPPLTPTPTSTRQPPTATPTAIFTATPTATATPPPGLEPMLYLPLILKK